MNAHSLSLAGIARALGGEVSGSQVLAPGPGHSATDRSLSVALSPASPDGFVVNSFANDPFDTCKDHVRSRLGLGDFVAAAPETLQSAKSGPDAEYIYKRADGTPYLRVSRWPGKGFSQSQWTGTGWAKGKPQGDPLPYRLPEMLSAVHDTVFVCEGEKDADALTARGFVATTNPEGAGKWRAELNQWFKNKAVFVMQDNDEAGRKHCEQVAGHLHGVASSVKVIALPGLPEKGDVSDWIAKNGTATLLDTCKSLPDARKASNDGEAKREPETFGTTLAALKRKAFPPVKWIVPDILPEGCTILAGKPKLGKSWLALDIAIAVSSGRYVLGDKQCEPGDVLYLALEDNERRLQDRGHKLLPLQDWPERLTVATEWPRADEGGAAKIERWAKTVQKPRLVIVDVLNAFRAPDNGKQSAYAYDYAAVKELRDLANRLGVAVVIVHHTRKGEAEDPGDTVSGTLGITGAADTTLVLSRSAEKGTTLYGRGRDVVEFDYALEWMPNSCRFSVKGVTAEVTRSDERSQIIAAIREAGEPLSPSEIAVETGMKGQNVRQLVGKMVRGGQLAKVGRKYGLPDRPDEERDRDDVTDHTSDHASDDVDEPFTERDRTEASNADHTGHTGHDSRNSSMISIEGLSGKRDRKCDRDGVTSHTNGGGHET